MRLPRNLPLLPLLAVIILGAVPITPEAVAAAPTASAQAIGWECTNANGVLVVVNFQELGGGIRVGCAPNAPRDGFEALRQAGFSADGTIRFPGFLCRINGKPANDPCNTASPADAYWSYWLAPRGGRWCYSNLGAGNRKPIPGTVEGWSFSKNKTAAQTPPPSAGPPPAPSGGSTPQIPSSHCTVPTGGAAPTTPRPAPPPTTRPAPPTTRRTPPPTSSDGTSIPSNRGGPRPDAPGPNRSEPGIPSPKKDRGSTTTQATEDATGEDGETDGSGDNAESDAISNDGTDRDSDSERSDGDDETAAAATAVHVNDPEAAAPSGGSGSPLPLVLTIVALVGGAGALTLYRRTRTPS